MAVIICARTAGLLGMPLGSSKGCTGNTILHLPHLWEPLQKAEPHVETCPPSNGGCNRNYQTTCWRCMWIGRQILALTHPFPVASLCYHPNRRSVLSELTVLTICSATETHMPVSEHSASCCEQGITRWGLRSHKCYLSGIPKNKTKQTITLNKTKGIFFLLSGFAGLPSLLSLLLPFLRGSGSLNCFRWHLQAIPVIIERAVLLGWSHFSKMRICYFANFQRKTPHMLMSVLWGEIVSSRLSWIFLRGSFFPSPTLVFQ